MMNPAALFLPWFVMDVITCSLCESRFHCVVPKHVLLEVLSRNEYRRKDLFLTCLGQDYAAGIFLSADSVMNILPSLLSV